MRIRLLMIALLVLLAMTQAFACRMMAVIALPGEQLNYEVDPGELNPFLLDELEALRLQGGSETGWPYNNLDGWGMAVTSQVPPALVTHKTRSEISAYEDLGYFDSTFALLDQDSVNILLGHLRQGSSGATGIANPHPFHYSDPSGAEFIFAHNGDVSKSVLRELIGDDWLMLHPPQTYGGGDWMLAGWDEVVDSELFFFWIIKSIQELGDIHDGLIQAIVALEDELPSQIKNFIFSDGKDLYAYRSSPAQDIHYLDIQPMEGEQPWYALQTNHRAVMSTPPHFGPLTEVPWVTLDNKTLLVFKKDGSTQFEFISDHLGSNPGPQPDSPRLKASAYPNPFNHGVKISLRGVSAGDYSLAIFDMKGRQVHQSMHRIQSSEFDMRWMGVDGQNRTLTSGQYIYRISDKKRSVSGKLLLLK